MIEIKFVLNFINCYFSRQTIKINILNFNIIKNFFFILIEVALDLKRISFFFFKIEKMLRKHLR